MPRVLILPVLVALFAAGFALLDSVEAGGQEWDMVALNDSGVSGSGNLVPMGTPEEPAEEVTFNLEMEGLEPDSEHAAHVHSGSSCDDIGEARFDLGTLTADADGNASLSTVVSTSPEVFAREDHLVIVYAGATLEGDATPISCGVLPKVEEEAIGRGEGTPAPVSPGEAVAEEPSVPDTVIAPPPIAPATGTGPASGGASLVHTLALSLGLAGTVLLAGGAAGLLVRRVR